MMLLGTTLRLAAIRVMLLSSGELGRKMAVECQRLGAKAIAANHYTDAPAVYAAHRSHAINMPDGDALRRVVELEKPRYTVSEIEAITTNMLIQLREEGLNVIPYTRTTKLAINREDIRRLVIEELQLSTSTCRSADSKDLSREVVAVADYPYIIKPMVSSSSKGQTSIRPARQLAHTWKYAQQGGRVGAGRTIVEDAVKLDFEIILLTVSTVGGAHFCASVGHRQEDGDYRESWQPQRMSPLVLGRAQEIAHKVVLAPGGYGLFGVELLVCDDEMIFSEVSPRPHDTGMVTPISQDLSEFALRVRAFPGPPVGGVRQYGPTVFAVILPQLTSQNTTFDNVQSAVDADLRIHLLGKPEVDDSRRLGVVLTTAENVVDAIERAKHATGQVKVQG